MDTIVYKKIFEKFLLTSVFLLGNVYIADANAKKINSGEIAEARNYILAACLINHYKGEPIAAEADAWASGLVENGKLSGATYGSLAELAKSAPQPGLSQQGIVMKLQNCVEFTNSKKLTIQLENLLRRK